MTGVQTCALPIWHSLLVLRKSLIEPVFSLETASNTVETTDMQAETQTAAAPDPDLLHTDDSDPDTNLHSALISEVATRISAVEDKFHVALTGMENKSDLTRLVLEGQLSSIEERAVKLYDIEKMVEKMAKLDNIEAKMAKLDDIEKRMAKLNDIEERMVKLHDIEERVVNLDDKIAELKDILGDLIERVRLVSSGSLTGRRSKN